MGVQDENTTRLSGLDVAEVSLVDFAANEEKFLVMKRLRASLAKSGTTPHPTEGETMVKDEVIEAAAAAVKKAEDEKTAAEATEKADGGAVIMAALESLTTKVEGLAETEEYKAIMAAAEAMMQKAAPESAAAGEGEEGDDEEGQTPAEGTEKADPAASAASSAAGVTPATPAAAGATDDIRALLISLNEKLDAREEAQKSADDPGADPKDAAIAKSIRALTERIDRTNSENATLRKRLEAFENTRGAARGEGDNARPVEKRSDDDIWRGLL